jgi:glycerophosphoinositol inositolphosphodiesterase
VNKRFLSALFHCVVGLHAGCFLAFWLTNSLFTTETNDYLADMLGSRQDYIRICLLLSTVLFLWSAVLLVLLHLNISCRFRKLVYYLNILYSLLFIAFFYGSFWLLFKESPSQIPRLRQLILYYRMIVDIGILGGVVVLGLLWLRSVSRRSPLSWSAYLRPLTAMFLLLLSVTLLPVIYPPTAVYTDDIPPKPRLIAHRGASFLAPENTLTAMELAAALGAYGLESDVRLTSDGVPILLHDDTFERTTDVAVVFPGREKQPAESFSWVEVQQLNAGSWFIDRDPYGTLARGELAASTAQLADLDQARSIYAQAPEMILVHSTDYRSPPSPQDLLASGYRIVNADFSLAPEMIRTYQDAGLWVSLYTVDEPWQFSRFWLTGVDSITTNNLHSFTVLRQPVFSLPLASYLALWLILSLFGASAVIYAALHFVPRLRPETAVPV